MKNIKSHKNYIYKFIIGLVILMLIFKTIEIITSCFSNNKAVNLSIIGNVDVVNYDRKKVAIVTVNSIKYSLSPFYVGEDDYVSIGDSLYKNIGQDTLYHFKRGNNKNYFLFGKHYLYHPWYEDKLCKYFN